MTISSDKLLNSVVSAIEEKKGKDVIALNLTGVSLIADYFVICHANSDVQVQSIATEIKKQAAEIGITVKGVEGYDTARWILVDLGDVIAHVFHREDREYYNIERLWSDAKVVELV